MISKPMPCVFIYFKKVPEWTKAFAFFTEDLSGRAFISFTENAHEIIYYCYGVKEEQPSCWIPDAPVLREFYDL